MEPFSPDFLATPVPRIIKSIEDKGYFIFPSALQPDFMTTVLTDLSGQHFVVNKNDVGPVEFRDQYYFTHAMARSRDYYNLVTHPKVREIASARLDPEICLKCHRYYETRFGHHMQWHTDNKTDRAFAEIPGIIFIFYLCDVSDGAFQYVKRSHRWSGGSGVNDYSEEFIENEHGSEIVDLIGPAGTMVAYDTYGIHRAKPIMDRNFTRRSIFIQVDGKTSAREKLLLNASFVDPDDREVISYLGLGVPSEYAIWPETSSRQLRAGDLGRLWMTTTYELARAGLRNVRNRLRK